jgi:hypothetical protein
MAIPQTALATWPPNEFKIGSEDQRTTSRPLFRLPEPKLAPCVVDAGPSTGFKDEMAWQGI